MEHFFQRFAYRPHGGHKLLSLCLLPFSWVYCLIAKLQLKTSSSFTTDLKVISVGNLVVGGTGKTPFVIALLEHYPEACVISRGYGRQSSGMRIVSNHGEIVTSVEESGDEAMLIARRSPQATVIVAEDRKLALKQAEELGCTLAILDDGYRQPVAKLNLLLQPAIEPHYRRCLPAGAYRLPYRYYRRCDQVIREGIGYHRKVTVQQATSRMVLVSAISNPERLEPYLPAGVVARHFLPDHVYFDSEWLQERLVEHNADSLLVTEKDAVKMEGFGLPISLLRLDLELAEETRRAIKTYLDD